ncbi:MAG: S1/P1 nuclease [Dysgonomonas sp.]|nr:S1/P1 nuclease [Dysgonomonas sp.]
MKKSFLLSLFIICLLYPTNVFGWGTIGHRVIAEIAQQNIKKSTNKQVNLLLNDLPMAYWANWADFIKSDKTGKWDHTHVWHFVNALGDLSKDDYIASIKNVTQQNIYSELPKLVNTLSNKNSTLDEKRTALIFIIHLVGDAHQPMHVGREEDLGGNKITLSWFGSPTNLHAVWDSKLVDYEKYSYTEYAYILNKAPQEKKKVLRKGSLEDWLYESHELANELYTSVNTNDNLMYEYSYKYKTVMETQLLKAGLRLAAILDMVFK